MGEKIKVEIKKAPAVAIMVDERLWLVVAQSFAGAAVVSSGLNKVEAKVKERAPLASFLRCYAHRLHLVLSQGASKLEECRLFFCPPQCSGCLFLQIFKDRSELLKRRLAHVAPPRWQHTSQLVGTVLIERDRADRAVPPHPGASR